MRPGSEPLRRAARGRPGAAAAVGAIATVAVAVAAVPFRDALGGANVALLLACIVVATAAYGGRAPATFVSVVAALAFTVLHTTPYLSFAIDTRDDVVTTALLIIVGLVAGDATERGWRHRDAALRRSAQVDQLHRVAELAASATDAAAIWPTIRDTLCRELHLGRCWFEPADHSGFPFPELRHTGAVAPGREQLRWRPTGFELPRNGVRLTVAAEGRELGRLVMLPDPGHGLTTVDRKMAVAVADQFGMVAARSDHLEPLW